MTPQDISMQMAQAWPIDAAIEEITRPDAAGTFTIHIAGQVFRITVEEVKA